MKFLADQLIMRAKVAKVMGGVMCCVILPMGLSACSGLSGNYPSVADIDQITQKILTSDERKKAIDEMTLENDELRAKTIKSIEKL